MTDLLKHPHAIGFDGFDELSIACDQAGRTGHQERIGGGMHRQSFEDGQSDPASRGGQVISNQGITHGPAADPRTVTGSHHAVGNGDLTNLKRAHHMPQGQWPPWLRLRLATPLTRLPRLRCRLALACRVSTYLLSEVSLARL